MCLRQRGDFPEARDEKDQQGGDEHNGKIAHAYSDWAQAGQVLFYEVDISRITDGGYDNIESVKVVLVRVVDCTIINEQYAPGKPYDDTQQLPALESQPKGRRPNDKGVEGCQGIEDGAYGTVYLRLRYREQESGHKSACEGRERNIFPLGVRNTLQAFEADSEQENSTEDDAQRAQLERVEADKALLDKYE